MTYFEQLSEEEIKKIADNGGASNKGKPKSEEHKRKLREAHQRRNEIIKKYLKEK